MGRRGEVLEKVDGWGRKSGPGEEHVVRSMIV